LPGSSPDAADRVLGAASLQLANFHDGDRNVQTALQIDGIPLILLIDACHVVRPQAYSMDGIAYLVAKILSATMPSLTHSHACLGSRIKERPVTVLEHSLR
jgi:hypothetical protein